MQLEKSTWMWILRMMAVTGVIYLSFRYLLLLFLPFLIALLLAALLRPVVRWLKTRLRLPVGAAAGICVCLFLAAAGFAVWKLLEAIARQAVAFARLLPGWLDQCMGQVETFCCRMEEQIALEPGTLTTGVRNLLATTGERLSEDGASLALDCSLPMLQSLIGVGVFVAFTVFAAMLILTGEEEYRELWQKLPFQRERSILGGRLKKMAGAWLRCELLAMCLTCLVCVAGIWLTGNSYALLLGLIIGILDALPLIGTGTVLLPWSLVCILSGQLADGLILAVTYGVCYLLRQLLETRMMGESLGSSPLVTLAAMYVGMKLFGLAGLLLGPAALMLIREILVLWKPQNSE